MPDPRDPRGVRYPLAGVLAVAVTAVLAGARSFAAIGEWAADLSGVVRARIGLSAAPDESTLRKLFARLDVDRLDRLPQTLCHGDTYPTNFKSRGTAGDEQTVALDWALALVGPVGYDLGGLAFGAYLNLPDLSLPEVDSALFEAYLAGLRESGCPAEVQQVRFGYAASAVLLIALFVLAMLNWQIQAGDAAEIDATRPNDSRPCFEAVMADIACELRDFV